MTIKQLGGVFGRNPTFNDVEVDNNLVVDNNLIVNNRIGVETSSPDELVHLYEPSGGDLALKIQSSPTAAYSSTRIKMKAGNLGVNEIYFGDASSDDVAKIRYEHSANAMAFKVNGQEALRINSSGNLVVLSGKGIDFSATSGTGTSELLSDYEEGVFSPTVIGTSTAGTASYTVQEGIYRKIGSVVYYSISLSWSSGTGTGNLYFAGLPFTSKSMTNYMQGNASIGSTLTIPANTYLGPQVIINSTQARVLTIPIGGGSSGVLAYDSSAAINITGFYFV